VGQHLAEPRSAGLKVADDPRHLGLHQQAHAGWAPSDRLHHRSAGSLERQSAPTLLLDGRGELLVNVSQRGL
jgi:hypothetical protein